MSKIELATVNTPLNSHEFQDQINRNFEKVSEALDNQLQRTAQDNVVNSMEQELNMGGNRIINLAKAVDPSDAMRKREFDEQIANIEQWAQEAQDSAASAAEDADDAEAAKRVAVSAAQSAQRHENAVQELHDALLADEHVPVVADNIADVITVAENIEDVNTTADNIEDIKAVFDIAKRIAYGNIGDIRATYKNTVPEGCRFADGTTVAKEDYPELFELLEAGTIASHTVADWTNLKNTYGVTGSFGFDKGVSSTVAYLPLLTEAFIEATNSTPHRINEAGLPNITGEAGNYGNGTGDNYYSSGAMYVREYTGVPGESEDHAGISSVYGIDASRSSSVYGKSDTVQPKSVMLRHYVVLTNSRQMILTVRPSVATKSALPTTGNINGDIRIVTNEGVAYVWARVSGTKWIWSSIGRVGTGGGTAAALWGAIEGDIRQQADLQAELDKKITNNTEVSGSLAIGEGAFTSRTDDIIIGKNARDLGSSIQGLNVAIGVGAKALSHSANSVSVGSSARSTLFGVAIGAAARATGTNAVALGVNSLASGAGSIQLGAGSNSEAKSLYVYLGTQTDINNDGIEEEWVGNNYKLLDADGKIPAERLPGDIGDSGDYYRSLDETQRNQILREGTYKGEDVEVGEIFTEYDGKFVEYGKELKEENVWHVFDVTSSPPSFNWPSDFVEGNGVVMHLDSGYVMLSYDGVRWETHRTLSASDMSEISIGSTNRKIVFNGSEFVYISSNRVYKSVDGIVWDVTRADLPMDWMWQYIEYSNGEYRLIDRSGVTWTSSDAFTWTQGAFLSDADMLIATKTPQGLYYVVNNLGSAFTSSDFRNWTQHSINVSFGKLSESIKYFKGRYVVLSRPISGNTKLYYSEDGVTFTEGTLASGAAGVFVVAGDKIYAYGRSSYLTHLQESSDGITFVETELPDFTFTTGSVFAEPFFYDNKFIILAGSSSSGVRRQVAVCSSSSFYEHFLTPLSYNKPEVDAVIAGVDLTGYLQNNTTADYAIAAGTGSSAGEAGTAVGNNSGALNYSVSYGYSAEAARMYSVSLGVSSQTAGEYATAIGYNAHAMGEHSIQIGYGTNSDEKTFKVGLASDKNYTLLNSDGTIPAERLVNAPTPDLTGYQAKIEDSEDIAFATADNFSIAGTMTISDAKEATGFTSNTNYLTSITHGIPAACEDFEMVVAFSSLSASVSGSLLTIPLPSGSGFNVGIRVYQGKINAFCGSTSTIIEATSTITANTKTYAKLVRKDGEYTLYSSADGSSWTEEASAEGTAIGSSIYATADIGKTSGGFLTVYLPETYIKVAGVETWRAVSTSKGLKLVSAPKTSTTAPDTATVGSLGQIFVDTVTGTGYMCVGVDTVTPAYTWKQVTA